MNCPYCGAIDSKVIDSRDIDNGVRRRRECLGCQARFTTHERVQTASLFVIKKDHRREEFRREKLLSGIRRACEKRPLPMGALDKLVEDIETELLRQGRAEVPASVIGDMVMERLKKLDYIAYIRFASVYREFADITELKREVDTLVDSYAAPPPNQLPLLPEEMGVSRRGGLRKKLGRPSLVGRK